MILRYVTRGPLLTFPSKVATPVLLHASAPIRFSCTKSSISFPRLGNCLSNFEARFGTLLFSTLFSATSFRNLLLSLFFCFLFSFTTSDFIFSVSRLPTSTQSSGSSLSESDNTSSSSLATLLLSVIKNACRDCSTSLSSSSDKSLKGRNAAKSSSTWFRTSGVYM